MTATTIPTPARSRKAGLRGCDGDRAGATYGEASNEGRGKARQATPSCDSHGAVGAELTPPPAAVRATTPTGEDMPRFALHLTLVVVIVATVVGLPLGLVITDIVR